MGQVEDTHRPRTSARLPGGCLCNVCPRHQGASRRKAARPDDTTRTPHHRGPGHGRATVSHARRGRNVDLRKGGNKHRHENGGDSTGRDGVCNPHRWVGVHDFVTHRSVGGCPRLCHPEFMILSRPASSSATCEHARIDSLVDDRLDTRRLSLGERFHGASCSVRTPVIRDWFPA